MLKSLKCLTQEIPARSMSQNHLLEHKSVLFHLAADCEPLRHSSAHLRIAKETFALIHDIVVA